MHRVDVRDVTERFGVALSDHDLVALLDELDSVFEFEAYTTLIVRPHSLHLNLNGLDGLAYATDVEHGLVAIRYRRVVVQHFDLGVEVLDAEALVRVLALDLGCDGVDQARSFSDLVVLDRLRILSDGLNVYAYRGHFTGLVNGDSVLVDALDDHWSEVAVAVRTEHHLLVELDLASEDGSTEDETDTLAEEAGVDDELGGDLGLSWLVDTVLDFGVQLLSH